MSASVWKWSADSVWRSVNVRTFENAHISSGDSGSEQKLGTCSVDIKYTIFFPNKYSFAATSLTSGG